MFKSSLFPITTAVFLLLLPALEVNAAGPPENSGGLSFVGSYGGKLGAINLNTHLGILDQGIAIQIVDVSAPDQPRFLGRINFPQRIDSIVNAGPVAYVTLEDDDAYVVDLADPNNPKAETFEGGASRHTEASLDAGHLVIDKPSKYGSSASVFDISNPLRPALVAEINGERFEAPAFTLTREALYFVDSDRTSRALHRYNGEDTDDPQSTEPPLTAPLVEIQMRAPYAKRELAKVDIAGLFGDFVWEDSKLFLRPPTQSGKPQSIEIPGAEPDPDSSDPSHRGNLSYEEHQRITGNTTLPPYWPETIDGIVADAGIAYAITHAPAIIALDLRDPANPKLLGSAPISHLASGIALSGTVVTVAEPGYSSIECFDVKAPSSPVRKGSLDLKTPFFGLVSDAGLVCCTAGSYIQIISITDPQNPIKMGEYKTSAEKPFIALRDRTLYIGAGELQVVNLANPQQPELMSHLAIENATLHDFAIAGNTLLDGAVMIDISNPAAPRALDSPIEDEMEFHFAASGAGVYSHWFQPFSNGGYLGINAYILTPTKRLDLAGTVEGLSDPSIYPTGNLLIICEPQRGMVIHQNDALDEHGNLRE